MLLSCGSTRLARPPPAPHLAAGAGLSQTQRRRPEKQKQEGKGKTLGSCVVVSILVSRGPVLIRSGCGIVRRKEKNKRAARFPSSSVLFFLATRVNAAFVLSLTTTAASEQLTACYNIAAKLISPSSLVALRLPRRAQLKFLLSSIRIHASQSHPPARRWASLHPAHSWTDFQRPILLAGAPVPATGLARTN